MVWRQQDSQRVIDLARGDSLTAGDRMVLITLLHYVKTYEAADPVSWVDKRQLAGATGMTPRSVQTCLGRLRKRGYVGESVSYRRKNGWTQYGYRLGPLTASGAPPTLTTTILTMMGEDDDPRA